MALPFYRYYLARPFPRRRGVPAVGRPPARIISPRPRLRALSGPTCVAPGPGRGALSRRRRGDRDAGQLICQSVQRSAGYPRPAASSAATHCAACRCPLAGPDRGACDQSPGEDVRSGRLSGAIGIGRSVLATKRRIGPDQPDRHHGGDRDRDRDRSLRPVWWEMATSGRRAYRPLV